MENETISLTPENDMAGTITTGSIVEVDEGHIWLTSDADEELSNGKGDEDDE